MTTCDRQDVSVIPSRDEDEPEADAVNNMMRSIWRRPVDGGVVEWLYNKADTIQIPLHPLRSQCRPCFPAPDNVMVHLTQEVCNILHDDPNFRYFDPVVRSNITSGWRSAWYLEPIIRISDRVQNAKTAEKQGRVLTVSELAWLQCCRKLTAEIEKAVWEKRHLARCQYHHARQTGRSITFGIRLQGSGRHNRRIDPSADYELVQYHEHSMPSPSTGTYDLTIFPDAVRLEVEFSVWGMVGTDAVLICQS